MDDIIGVPAIIYINKTTYQIEKIEYKSQVKNNKNGFSKAENTIWNWLKYNNINFEFQKRFSDCKDKNTLPLIFIFLNIICVLNTKAVNIMIPVFIYVRKKVKKKE